MSIDRTSNTTREDDTPTPTTSGDTSKSPEQTGSQQTGTNDDRAPRRAETRTREEHADAVRADGGPISSDTRRDDRENPEREAGSQPDRRTDHDWAESRDRETYADEVRADHSGNEQQDQTTEVRTLTGADQAGTSDRPDDKDPITSGQRPESDQPAGHAVSADQDVASVHDQQEARYQPETVTFDNKDIEITHNSADGIWIEGLPGDPPTRIGDLVRTPEDPAQGRAEKLRHEVNKEAEDISDTASKWADSVQEILDPPRPTHSMTHSPAPEIATTGPQGINAGQGAEALLTVAIVGAAAIHKLHDRLQRAWEH